MRHCLDICLLSAYCRFSHFLIFFKSSYANLAQSVEQRPRKAQVISSILIVGYMIIFYTVSFLLFFIFNNLFNMLDIRILSNVTKFLCSASYMMTGIMSYKKSNYSEISFKPYRKLILAGIILCAIADVVYEFIFEAGFALFLTAMVLFCIATFRLNKVNIQFFILSAICCISIGIFEIAVPVLEFGILLTPILIYMVIMICTIIKSTDLMYCKTFRPKLFTTGIILFFISDFILQFAHFTAFSSHVKTLLSYSNNVTYFPGMIFIALSLGEEIIFY